MPPRACLSSNLLRLVLLSPSRPQAWDRNGDGELTESEFVSRLSTLFYCARDLWEKEILPLARHTFARIAATESCDRLVEVTLSVTELEVWLRQAVGDDEEGQRQAVHTCPVLVTVHYHCT